MKLSIDATTAFWTDITMSDHNGNTLEFGMEQFANDTYYLKNYPRTIKIGRRTSYIRALHDALEIMEKELKEKNG